MRYLGVAALLAVGLSGCSMIPFAGDQPSRGGGDISAVLAELPELELPTEVAAAPTQAEVMAAYERVYGLIPNARDNRLVGKRLADLKMAVGEDRDIAGVEQPYDDAVALYESLLLDDATEGQDQILYQLARAYDVVGNVEQAVVYLDRLISEHPQSPYALEAHFRRAEIAFSREQYGPAAADYGFVVAAGHSPYWQNATYMLGWSNFKRNDPEAGLASFFKVIDALLAGTDVAQLAPTDQELLDDSFRVVTLALSYLDGAQTLAQQMHRLGRPEWQFVVYDALARAYVEDERFLDSVNTWQRFIEENSLDARAPSAHIGMIDTLASADFPSEIRPKKAEFVRRYGITSEFWVVHDSATRESYSVTLRDYLIELAEVAQAEAQTSAKPAAYIAAANWYEEIVATFPDDPATAEYVFLLGEVYTEAGEHGKAVAAYQRVVREFGEFPKANEAGYAAILGLAQLVASAPPGELELWQRLKIDAQIEFALNFPADERAPSAQLDAADTLFALAQYAEALDLAQNLLLQWPEVAPELRKPALLILGHCFFELEDFVAAEGAYRDALTLQLAAHEQQRVTERLLATVFKQAEASEASGAGGEAIYHYLRVGEIDPNAELAIQGHFDAVAVLEREGRTGEAAELLSEFRRMYPQHELGRDTAKRLAAMYEHTEDWGRAAAEYVRLARNSDEPEVARQATYRAAELYLRLDDLAAATAHFKAYAHTYMEPKDLRLEAIHHLDLICQRSGNADDRRFWLGKKIDLYRSMGNAPSARATYLAVEAEFVFAEEERARFDAVRLHHPLNKSLKRKQQALKRTVKAFERVAEYQVADYATASTFHIADLYAALSIEIMNSDRPHNLSELELEQYEILLEEQAFPFEEQAIGLHEINMRRSWEGVYDGWVKKSFAELRRLMPARFDKQEVEIAYVDVIY